MMLPLSFANEVLLCCFWSNFGNFMKKLARLNDSADGEDFWLENFGGSENFDFNLFMMWLFELFGTLKYFMLISRCMDMPFQIFIHTMIIFDTDLHKNPLHFRFYCEIEIIEGRKVLKFLYRIDRYLYQISEYLHSKWSTKHIWDIWTAGPQAKKSHWIFRQY